MKENLVVQANGTESPELSGIPRAPSLVPTQYPYSPLDINSHEIRLLRIGNPPEYDSMVNCIVEHVSLDSHPSYEALSYTWRDSTGSAELNKAIRLNGHTVAVTRNLEAALRKLLMGDEPRTLWVDAICIHQTDVKERNEQVSKMKLIYEHAEQVITWLGEETDGSRGAFELLWSFKELGVPKSMCSEPTSWNPTTPLSEEIVEKVHAIFRLFKRDYWQRAWVVQEVAFAKKLVLHCGPDCMTWDEMESSSEALRKDGYWFSTALQSSNMGHILPLFYSYGPFLLDPSNSARQRLKKDPSLAQDRGHDEATLGDVLIRHRAKKSTEPQDKIYSVLGLVSSEVQRRLPVNYRLDSRTVYLNTATFIALEEHDLRFLAENKPPRVRDPNADKSPALPSWVPNYANTHEAYLIRIDRTGSWLTASGTRDPDVSLYDREVLSVTGICIGTVTKVGVLMPDFDGDDYPFQPAFNALYDWWLNYLLAGGTNMTGPNSFLELLSFGFYTRNGLSPEMNLESNATLMRHLRILRDFYQPNDTTLDLILPDPLPVVTDSMRRQAEADIWSTVPRIRNRRLFVVDGFRCGIGPQCTEMGDLAIVIFGCDVPILVRKKIEEDDGGYYNLGDTYVDGVTGGELVKDLENGKCESEVFHLH